METVGFMSKQCLPSLPPLQLLIERPPGVSGLDSPNRSELAFSRRYLDQNRNTVRI